MDDTQNKAVTPPVDPAPADTPAEPVAPATPPVEPVPSDPTATPSPSQDDVADIKLPGEASEESIITPTETAIPTPIPSVEDKPVVPTETVPSVDTPATPPVEPTTVTDEPEV